MPIQELLAQVAVEYDNLQSNYDNLQSKHDEALREISLLHTRLPVVHAAEQLLTVESSCKSPTEYSSQGLQEDTEAFAVQKKFTFASFHGTHPPGKDGNISSIDSLETYSRPMGKGFSSNSIDVMEDTPPERMTLPSSTQSYRSFGSLTTTRELRVERQSFLQGFLSSLLFEAFLIVLLFANCAIMWIDTDRRASMLPTESWLEASDYFFSAIYMVEFGLRVCAYRMAVFHDVWTRLDFLIVLMDSVSMVVKHGFGSAFLGGVNISLVRLLRVFRVARVFKVLRFVAELRLLIHGLYGAMKAVFFAVIMLEIVLLLWCFVIVESIHPLAVEMQCEPCSAAYSSMWRAHLTLVQQVIAGDSWGQVNLLIITAHPETAVIFFGCLVTIQFTMVNLIFTVIVDAAHRARLEDDKHMLAEKEHTYLVWKRKLLTVCKELDVNDDGELDHAELLAGYDQNGVFSDILAHMDIEKEDLEILFWIMDEDRSGTVSYVEFVNNIYKLKEQDLHTTLMFLKAYMIEMRIKMLEELQPSIAQTINISKTTQKDLVSFQRQFSREGADHYGSDSAVAVTSTVETELNHLRNDVATLQTELKSILMEMDCKLSHQESHLSEMDWNIMTTKAQSDLLVVRAQKHSPVCCPPFKPER